MTRIVISCARWGLYIRTSGIEVTGDLPHLSGGGDRGEHHYLERRMQKQKFARSADDPLKVVREVIASAQRDDIVVLSHESLGKEQQCGRLRGFLRECGVEDRQLSVMAYVRSPIDHYPSAVQQSLKNRHRDVRSPRRWISHHMATFEEVTRTFGPSAFFRAYSRDALVEGDTVSDFSDFVIQRCGVSLPAPSRRIVRNTSLSSPACALLAVAKTAQVQALEPREFTMMRDALSAYDREIGGAKLEMPAEWNAWIAAVNRGQWNPLVDRLPYDDTIKRGLKLDDAVPKRPVSISDVKSWIMSYHDAGYAAELGRMIAGGPKGETRFAKSVSAWLDAVSRSTIPPPD